MPKNIRTEKVIKVPGQVKVEYKAGMLKVTGPKGALSRRFDNPRMKLDVAPKEITISIDLPNRKEYALIGTFESHINNLITGVTTGYSYKMKIVYSHFPIKATI